MNKSPFKKDLFNFRAWIEVPLKDKDGKERTFGFYMYDIDVYAVWNGKQAIGFLDTNLSDTVWDLPVSEDEKTQIWEYFEANNDLINTEDYFRYSGEFEIEPSTGIRDKNGKIIYEGDIVKMDADCFCADTEQVGKPCYVEFGEMAFWFVYPQIVDNEHKSAGWNECAEYEIVGNIRQDKDKWFPGEMGPK
jgi:hypothetical protein